MVFENTSYNVSFLTMFIFDNNSNFICFQSEIVCVYVLVPVVQSIVSLPRSFRGHSLSICNFITKYTYIFVDKLREAPAV